jgi:hypothetical protein
LIWNKRFYCISGNFIPYFEAVAMILGTSGGPDGRGGSPNSAAGSLISIK